MGNIRESYSVQLSPIDKVYKKQIGLKNNPEYENWADKVAIALIERFQKQYEGVRIEIPKIREKSCKSILGKLKNLQIERLSKLFALEELEEKDKEEIYGKIKERIEEVEDADKNDALNLVSKLIYEDIEKFNVSEFEKVIMQESYSKSTKTALLRMLVGKIDRSNMPEEKKTMVIDYIDSKYGKKAAIEKDDEEADILRYASVSSLNDVKIERLKNEDEFLRANDLRGMKIVPIDVVDNFHTENDIILELLEKRKNEINPQKRSFITHQIMVEIGKEFYTNIEEDQQFLDELDIEIIPGSSKHKKKANGYEAEHIKFISKKDTNYTLEMQFKSEYVETMCRGTGQASHENRPGKSRNLPDAQSDAELKKKLDYLIPKYKVYKTENGHITPKKFNTLENIMGYFQEQIDPSSEEFDKIVELYSDEIEK